MNEGFCLNELGQILMAVCHFSDHWEARHSLTNPTACFINDTTTRGLGLVINTNNEKKNIFSAFRDKQNSLSSQLLCNATKTRKYINATLMNVYYT